MDATDTDASDEPEIRDPEAPLSQQVPVNPSQPGGPTEGLTTMQSLFPGAQVVDEVQEYPMAPQVAAEWWVIRTNEDVEDMTVGEATQHFAFKAGIRYRVPQRVAEILADRDKLMEVPYPFDERYARR
jgi:hypothetical protein